jgi:hypothetical protein
MSASSGDHAIAYDVTHAKLVGRDRRRRAHLAAGRDDGDAFCISFCAGDLKTRLSSRSAARSVGGRRDAGTDPNATFNRFSRSGVTRLRIDAKSN